MLGTGKSFRTARDADTIRQGFTRAVLYGEAAMRAGSVDLTCAIERGGRGTQKTYTVNGSAVRYAGYLGRIRVVPFVPIDLQLAGGPPGTRRAFLNGALSQSEPGVLPRTRALSKSAPAKERAPARHGSSRRRASRGLRCDAHRRRHAHHFVARAVRRGAVGARRTRARAVCTGRTARRCVRSRRRL